MLAEGVFCALYAGWFSEFGVWKGKEMCFLGSVECKRGDLERGGCDWND